MAAVEISLGTPLADALSAAIVPKLSEAGWSSGGADDAALSEYIILMLVNGKNQDQIATELASELLGLNQDDPVVHQFSKWLFEQIELLNSKINGVQSIPQQDAQGGSGAEAMATAGEMDTDMGAGESADLNVPTGPRSMRNGAQRGRDRRMLDHMSKAMGRTGDPLHSVRGGGGRINTHSRGPPSGPRGRGGIARNNNNNMNNSRAASIQHGLAGNAPGWMMGQPNQMELVAMLEQQNQMMFQLSQQLMNGQAGGGGGGGGGGGFGQRGRGGGKSLFERTNGHRKTQKDHKQAGENGSGNGGEGDDMEMTDKQAANPEESICRFNLKCTNKECKFAHQSPAAPPGITLDISDVCSYGAACKNRKCVGRHPSPAQKFAHQSEQECKFFPNCQNPRCPFKHPSMPLCRNGADCTTEDCKFTHVRTKCKFNPCLNRSCAFQHDDGQQGGFRDKVWTAEGSHVSDRKFVDDEAGEEEIRPEEDGDHGNNHQHSDMQDADAIL